MGLYTHFRFRPFVSVLTGFSFLVVMISGAALYLSPQGRIANQTNWTFWHLSKHQWSDVHVCFSVLFIAASVFHIALNAKALLGYFVCKVQAVRRWRIEWAAALVLCGVVWWGTLKPVAPFSHILKFSEQLRYRQPGQVDAEPTVQARGGRSESGFGQQTLSQVCASLNLSTQEGVARLAAAGIEALPEQTIRTIADNHTVHPREIRQILQSDSQ